jgi:hypothetical protein
MGKYLDLSPDIEFIAQDVVHWEFGNRPMSSLDTWKNYQPPVHNPIPPKVSAQPPQWGRIAPTHPQRPVWGRYASESKTTPHQTMWNYKG